MKKIIVLGSTGIIGQLTMDIIRNNPDKYTLVGISAKKNISGLINQINEFKPSAVHIFEDRNYNTAKLKEENKNVDVYTGDSGIYELLDRKCDIVVNAISGFAGLIPSLLTLKHGVRLALANKESMVVAGQLMNDYKEKYNAQIIPVDSEHSAISQCIDDHDEYVKNIILTASGGPFRGKNKEQLKNVTCEDALKHPTWKMGNRITIDSATLMNKGMEIIEAKWLFGLKNNQIHVLVHPQSILHSMVQFIDNNYMGLMSEPDMRIPIAYALSYPERTMNNIGDLDLSTHDLTFEKVDTETFEAIEFAYNVMEKGGTYPVIFNSADEIAVDAFLNNKIGFLDIIDVVKYALNENQNINNPSLQEILTANDHGKSTATQYINYINRR